MNSVAEIVARLIAAGTPPEVAAVAVTEAFAAGACVRGNPVDETAEKRRTYDRERKQRERDEKRKSGGNPVESADCPQTALTLKKKDKKVRTQKHPLPPDFQPSESHFAYGAERGYSREGVLEKTEDMRIWAASSGALKADWGATLLGFLRRDSPKPSQKPRAGPMLTITPASKSWNAWKTHFRDTGKNNTAAMMDKCASDGKPFTVQSEWPPGMAA